MFVYAATDANPKVLRDCVKHLLSGTGLALARMKKNPKQATNKYGVLNMYRVYPGTDLEAMYREVLEILESGCTVSSLKIQNIGLYALVTCDNCVIYGARKHHDVHVGFVYHYHISCTGSVVYLSISGESMVATWRNSHSKKATSDILRTHEKALGL